MATNMTNGAYSTLASGITSGATSLSVASGEGARFPSSNFYICVYDSIYPNWAVAYRNSAGEIMLCSSRSTDTLTVTRAQGGTSAVAFNTTGRTYRVEQNPTAEAFEAATASASGLVSTSAQSFAGAKTFRDNIVVGVAETTVGTVSFKNGNDTNTLTLTSPTGLNADATITLPSSTGTLITSAPSIIQWAVSGNVIGGQTGLYYLPGVDATSSPTTNNRFAIIPFDCTIDRFCFKTNSNTFTGTMTATIQKNGSDTALALTVTTETAKQNTSDSVSFSAYDTINLKIATTAGSNNIFWPTFAVRVRA